MNKLTMAMNVWRAYSAARKTEGSSLRGLIMGGVSAVAVVVITLLRGDLTATDVGVIAAGISGLDAVLKYFIPDQLGQTQTDALPPIDLVSIPPTGTGTGQLRQPVPSDTPSDGESTGWDNR